MIRLAAVAIVALPAVLAAQTAQTTPPPAPFKAKPYADGPVKVGPAKGTIVVVGGGGMGPEIYKAFIDAAGGPDALILDVPNASGSPPGANSGSGFRNAGARNVVTLYTTDRKIADSDSFVAIIKKAGGVWFGGGRQFHLVDDYGGTKTEREFMAVLERGGVVGGSSAGASILGDYMVRGAPSSNNMIIGYPGYEHGFGYLRNVGVDQHVVARSRIPDIADSLLQKYPTLLGISEDEGTAWVIKGDTGWVIGRSKAFVTNGKDPNDPGSPFLSLFPGDRYNLNTRRVISRALDRSTLKLDLINSLFAKYNDASAGGATVLVALNGEVLIDHAFGIPAQTRHQPRTTVPQFALGDLATTFTELCAQMPAPAARGGNAAPPDSTAAAGAAGAAAAGGGGGGRGGRGGGNTSPLQSCVSRVGSPVGAQQTSATADGVVQSNVDALFRISLGFDVPTTWRNADYTKGWTSDTYKGITRLAAYGTADGKRAAFVRVPDRRAVVIILTNDASADTKGMSEKILDQLLALR